MVDLKSQYQKIKKEIDEVVLTTIASTAYINGPGVKNFQQSLEKYLGVNHVIPCANGTDALQIALMALGLKQGDEVILPAFTYVATAEVVALLGLKPVLVDVDRDSFNISIDSLTNHITNKTKAIVPVHLFGQCSNMEAILKIAKTEGIDVVEDNAQAIGADYFNQNGTRQKAGTIGDIGCTSFYPSKNLGCYGDGGALCTNDDQLAKQIRLVANHGQNRRYYHDVVGVNSRLDSIQAAILNIKLKYLDEYITARQKAADYYDKALSNISGLQIPKRVKHSAHVFHQYTILVKDGKRDELKAFLAEKDIPSMIYYPVPLYKQKAYQSSFEKELPNTEFLCQSVLSLPMHTELSEEILEYICDGVQAFF
ncbi:MAG TPA: DegT/DnrJ/EryC1/StrS family aminotransferase [Saprospiraceae bacterium]|nr:DegT/DnrJ/EryC1/StrS family aminotransferase [Saprospiraceae bacterium]